VETEYIGASDAAKEAIWISSLFTRLLGLDAHPQEIFVDSQGAIQLAKNPKFHERTKHIGVRYHFIRDACERNVIRTTYLPTSEYHDEESPAGEWVRNGTLVSRGSEWRLAR